VAEALRCHLPGLLFAAVDQVLIFAFYARKDTLTPALVGVGTTVLYALTAIALAAAGVLTLPLLVLVNSGKWTAHALTMLYLTRRRLGGLGASGVWGLLVRVTVASLALAAAAWGVARLLGAWVGSGLLGELVLVGGAGGAGVAVYVLLSLAMRVEEVHLLRAALADALLRG